MVRIVARRSFIMVFLVALTVLVAAQCAGMCDSGPTPGVCPHHQKPCTHHSVQTDGVEKAAVTVVLGAVDLPGYSIEAECHPAPLRLAFEELPSQFNSPTSTVLRV